MGNVNEIYLDDEFYNSKESRDKDLTAIINVLLKNHYTIRVDVDDFDNVVITYNPRDPKLGCSSLYWLSTEEVDYLQGMKYGEQE